jgi:hypothetical protein
MDDGSDLEMDGHDVQAIPVSNNQGMDGHDGPDYDEKHVEWMEASFMDLMRLASPSGSDDNDHAVHEHDEKHVEWMEASFMDLIRLASPSEVPQEARGICERQKKTDKDSQKTGARPGTAQGRKEEEPGVHAQAS